MTSAFSITQMHACKVFKSRENLLHSMRFTGQIVLLTEGAKRRQIELGLESWIH